LQGLQHAGVVHLQNAAVCLRGSYPYSFSFL
jgi:hypothetical protein